MNVVQIDSVGTLLVVRFSVHAQPGKAEEVMAALQQVVAPSRALDGVVSFDIGRDVTDPEIFIATEVFESREALHRGEALAQRDPRPLAVDHAAAMTTDVEPVARSTNSNAAETLDRRSSRNGAVAWIR